MNTKTCLYTLLIAGIAFNLFAETSDQAFARSMERQQQIAISLEKASDSASMTAALNSLEKSWRETVSRENQSDINKEVFVRAFLTNYQAALQYAQRFNSSPSVSIAIERLNGLMRSIEGSANSSKAHRNAMRISSILYAAMAAGYPSESWKSVRDAINQVRKGFMVKDMGPFKVDGLSDADVEAAMVFLSQGKDGSIRYIGPSTP